MQLETEEYMTIERVNAVRERAGKLRRQFLKYKDAESVYSLTHRKLLEMADEAGAIYRIDGTVLINRDIFDEYLEQFHQNHHYSMHRMEQNEIRLSYRSVITNADPA